MSESPEQKLVAARARMAEIAVKFVERSQAEMGVLRARLAAVADGDARALADIRNLAHRMCGTGATLGFEALAEQARRVELMTASMSAAGAPDPTALGGLAREIESLSGEVARLLSRASGSIAR